MKRIFTHKKSILFFISILGLVMFLVWLNQNKNIDVGNKHSRQQLKGYMQSHHINGVMLVTGKDGNPIVIKNEEISNSQQTVQADQLFPIASLQKLMTGTATYELKQKRDLYYNTQLSNYYPQVSGSNDITIYELMNHTSGLSNNARPSEPLKTQESQIAYMLKYMKNDHLHIWDYQDVDYELLAAIISKKSKMSYNKYIKENFSKSLHLKKIKDFAEVKQSEVPQPMNASIDWQKVTVTTSSDFGAGNLFMSPNDYWKFVYNKALKNPKMLSEFFNEAKGQEVPYFGGVYFRGNVIHAEGSIPGYNSCFVANYKTKQMVMLFSNNINYLKLKQASDHILHKYF